MLTVFRMEYEYDFYLVYNHDDDQDGGNLSDDIKSIRKQIMDHLESEPNTKRGYDLLRDSTPEERAHFTHQIKMMNKCRHFVCVLGQSCLSYSTCTIKNAFLTQVRFPNTVVIVTTCCQK